MKVPGKRRQRDGYDRPVYRGEYGPKRNRGDGGIAARLGNSIR